MGEYLDARDLVEAERDIEPEDERKKAKAALTDLFQQVNDQSFSPYHPDDRPWFNLLDRWVGTGNRGCE